MSILIFSIIQILIINLSLSKNKIKDFRRSPLGVSYEEGIFDIDLGIEDGSRIVSYIDYDNDKKTDIFVLNNDKISVFLYNDLESKFLKETKVTIPVIPLKDTHSIYEVIPVDLDSDDKVDLIVTSISEDNTTMNVFILLQNEKDKFELEGNVIKCTPGIVVYDGEGNNLKEILYFDEVNNQRMYVTIEKKNEKKELKTYPFSNHIHPSKECQEFSNSYKSKKITLFSSSAFVDIDGDCNPDLIFTSYTEEGKKQIEIWRGKIDENNIRYFCLSLNSVIPIENELETFTIGDVNRDGMLDLVFPINSIEARVLIVYNKIKSSWDDNYCNNIKSSTGNKSINDPLIFTITSNLTISNTNNEELYLNFNNQIVNVHSKQNQEFYSNNVVPVNVRLGDVNSDSFPDLIVVLKNSKEKNENNDFVLMINSPYKNNSAMRDFIFPDKSLSIDSNFFKNQTLLYSSFFDLDENGILDIVITSKDTSTGKYFNYGFFNNNNYDSFFLKSITTFKKNIFNQAILGVTYRYVVTNLDGTRRKDVSFQLAQIGGLALSSPFSLIGIGRSNNYIENFNTISSNIGKSEYYKSFTPIIPNSHLLISENLDETTVYFWELELIINPMSILLVLIIAIGGILVVLLISICYLHRLEVKEDQENDNPHLKWFD